MKIRFLTGVTIQTKETIVPFLIETGEVYVAEEGKQVASGDIEYKAIIESMSYCHNQIAEIEDTKAKELINAGIAEMVIESEFYNNSPVLSI